LEWIILAVGFAGVVAAAIFFAPRARTHRSRRDDGDDGGLAATASATSDRRPAYGGADDGDD
jgi:hypothetical protein